VPIVTPTSGQVIQTTDFITMHSSVRSIVNAQGPTTIGRSAFSSHHLPSLVMARDSVSGGPELVNTAPATPWQDSAAWMLTEFQDLPTFHLDNGGTFYTLAPCLLMFVATVELTVLSAACADEHQFWVAPYIRINGASVLDRVNARCTWGFSMTGHIRHDEPVTIAWQHDMTGYGGAVFTLTAGLRATKYKSSEVAAVPDFTIDHGELSFVAYHKALRA